jgi:hypothetical protein
MSTLKQDKMCALELLKNANLSPEDLQKLKVELQKNEPGAPLKFMKELRSQLWLIKKIRGAYGETTTSKMMNDIIDSKISALEKAQGIKPPVPLEAPPNPALPKLEKPKQTQVTDEMEVDESTNNFSP